MPFAGYEDFAACVAANQDKDNPEAYCGAIQAKVEKTREVLKHYAPRHPGTGTAQKVHAGGQARFYSDPVEGEWRTHQFAPDRPNISKRAILDYRLQPVRGRFAHAFKTYRGDDRGYTELDPLKGGGLFSQGAYASLLDPSGVAFQTGPSQRSSQAAGVDFNLENTLYLKVGGEGRLQPGWDDIQDAVFDLAIELYEKQYGPVAPGQSWPELLRRVGVDGVVLDFDDSIFRPGELWGSQIVAFPWAKDRPKIRRFVNRVKGASRFGGFDAKFQTPREFIEDVRKAKPKSPKLFRLVLLEDFERQLLKESILLKHAVHDQSDHGNWARSYSFREVLDMARSEPVELDLFPDQILPYLDTEALPVIDNAFSDVRRGEWNADAGQQRTSAYVGGIEKPIDLAFIQDEEGRLRLDIEDGNHRVAAAAVYGHTVRVKVPKRLAEEVGWRRETQVEKHASHDQSDHGNWARSFKVKNVEGVTDKTFDMREWKSGRTSVEQVKPGDYMEEWYGSGEFRLVTGKPARDPAHPGNDLDEGVKMWTVPLERSFSIHIPSGVRVRVLRRRETQVEKHGEGDQKPHGNWAEGHTQAFAAAITPAASTFLDSNPDAVARYRTPDQLASTMADVHARLMTRGGFSTDDLEDLQVYSRLTGYTPTELSTLHSQMNAMSTAMSTMGADWLAEFGKNLDFVRDFFKHASHNQKDHGNRRRAALAWTGSPSEYPAHSSIRGLAMRISEGELDEPIWWGDRDSDSKGLDFPTFLEHTKTLLDAVDSDEIDRPLYRGLFLHGKYHKDAISRFTTPGAVVKHRTLLSSFTERKDLAERFASGEFHFARKDPDTVSLLLKIKTGRGLNLDPFLRDEPSLKGTEIIDSKEWIVGGPFKVVDVSSTGPSSYEVTVERAKEVRKHAAPVHPGTGTGQEVHGGLEALSPPSGPSKGMDPSDVADKAIKLGVHKVYASSIRDMADWASTKSGKQYGDRITGRFVDVKMARGSDAKFWPLEGSIVLTRDDGQKFRLYLKGKDYKVDPIAKHYGPGPHPSGTTQDVHGGERISPFNRALKGVENTMEAIAAVDPKLPIKVIAQWEKIGGTSRRQIRDRYIRLIEAAKKNNNWADGMDWYWRQHRDLTALADQYNQWDLQTMAAAAAALSPQTEWNANLRYTVEMAKFLDHDLIEDLSDAQLELVNAKLDADGHNLTVTNGSRLSKLTPRQATIVMFEMSKNLSDDNNGWGSGAGYTPFSDAVELFRGAKPNILRGVKTRSFYNMLFDPSNVVDVTIDFQMMEAAAGRVLTKNENSSLNSTPSIQVAGEKTSIGVRPYLADITRSVAAKFGITPSQAQAIIWLQWKDTK